MSTAPEILIVADDLSGAADCAIACFAAGIDSFVALDGDQPVPSAGAIAIDTDSRRLDPDAAAAVTAHMLRRHAGPQTRLIYKKMDSTARGNFAAEIAAGLAVVRNELNAPQAVAILRRPIRRTAAPPKAATNIYAMCRWKRRKPGVMTAFPAAPICRKSWRGPASGSAWLIWPPCTGGICPKRCVT